jgi:nucleoside-diphosphate-sugar epimerase
LYGPRTLNALHGDSTAAIRRGERAATNSMTSWLHVGDAASSTLAALSWEPGLYNVVDDEPALETEWLPLYAQIVGGPVPRMETVERPKRGASNAKARSTGWEPTFRSWRDGFPAALLEP